MSNGAIHGYWLEYDYRMPKDEAQRRVVKALAHASGKSTRAICTTTRMLLDMLGEEVIDACLQPLTGCSNTVDGRGLT